MRKIKVSKNQKIMAIKIMAQIVSTWHMFDSLGYVSVPLIAIIGAVALGTGEYMISNEYASMPRRSKMKSILLYSLIGLSAISFLANIESTMRYIDWDNIDGLVAIYYTAVAGLIYAVAWPTIIVTTSFIKLEEPEIEEMEEIEEEEEIPVIARQPTRRYHKRGRIDPATVLSPEVLAHVQKLAARAQAGAN